jgi:hypothetical protein
MRIRKAIILYFAFFQLHSITAQNQYELNSGWYCSNVNSIADKGEKISLSSYPLSGWIPATVPGTVLTTLLNNKLVPDPFYGMNNKKIPDIYETGTNYYTYWFVKDFKETASKNELLWLHLRGVNYGCDIFLNGNRLNPKTHYGMFLRQTYNITQYLSKDGNNRLAIIVYPPDPPGNPNGGQGGDGTIARNVTHQYPAGWDWIQPVRDRNTGIWDKVTIEKTIAVNLKNPHIITLVPGKRFPDAAQEPAFIKTSVEIENTTNTIIAGTLQFEFEGKIIKRDVTLQPKAISTIQLPGYTLKNPKLWWSSGYGPQSLYDGVFRFISKNTVFDEEKVSFGIREIQTRWNDKTRSRQVFVNGQKIFIKGGNWIISDALLRLSEERYDAEIRIHKDMNLNLIRVWGGALLERPEFYKACDKYGLLVFQDLWMSGDCNGKWIDPLKKDDQWTRRKYPDDHQLFLASVADQVKMVRNHPSLAFWCGGNEITPPQNILEALQDSILPNLDGTRYFFPYSNSDSMSYNFLGGNGDGPYTIQPENYFWEKQNFPFNSEIGSVGTGDYESLERFIPKENLKIPGNTNNLDSVWNYHKYIGYDGYLEIYGKPTDIKDFANKAQLVNYNQYHALMEGFSSHAWDWYTGVIIWKTQNPWTALRGQMYDYYLDPNAGLYGLRNAGEPIHVMYNPVEGMVMIVNNTFKTCRDLMLQVKTYDMKGVPGFSTQVLIEIGAGLTQKYLPVTPYIEGLTKKEGIFLLTKLTNQKQETVSENLYWLPDSTGNYSGLQKMLQAQIKAEAQKLSPGKIEVKISTSANGPLAFFLRLSLVNETSKKRILPVFYSNNYISVLPGEAKKVIIEYQSSVAIENSVVSLFGWNVEEQFIKIK